MNTAEFLRQNARWLGAGALLTFLSSFGQTFFISLFSQDIRDEFGLSDGGWGLIYSAGTTLSAIIMVWLGTLTDTYRTRSLGVWVLVGLAASCLFMAVNPSIAGLLIAVLLLRLTGQGMASHAAVVAMARWFVATRGRALATSNLGFTIGEASFPLIVVGLLIWFDWRVLWIVAAAIALLGVPILIRLLKSERHPKELAKESQSVGMGGQHWTRMQVLRHPLFWFMVPAVLGTSAFNTAFFFHHVHFAQIKGWSHFELVTLFPIYTITSVAVMLMSGWALDKWGTPRLIPWYQLPMCIAFLTFAFGSSPVALIFGFFTLACSAGANSTLPNAFWAEFFGTQYIGSIKAMVAAVMVLGSAIGPGITGLLIDAGIGLDTQYVMIAGYFLLVTVSMLTGIRLYGRTIQT